MQRFIALLLAACDGDRQRVIPACTPQGLLLLLVIERLRLPRKVLGHGLRGLLLRCELPLALLLALLFGKLIG